MINIQKISVEDFDYALIEYKGDFCVSNDLKAFRRHYIMTMSEVLDQGPTPVILSLPPVDITRSIDGASSYLWHEAINMELYRIAVENGFQFIDITTPILRTADLKTYLGADGMQLSDAGNRLVDSIVRNELQTI